MTRLPNRRASASMRAMSDDFETWTWGHLFELDLPRRWSVHDRDGAVELCPVPGADGIHLATLDLPPEQGPDAAAATILARFAATRGHEALAAGPAERDPFGVARTRARFAADDGHWFAGAAAWDFHVVLCTAFARAPDARLLHVAEELFEALRPTDAAAAVVLPPDAPGDF